MAKVKPIPEGYHTITPDLVVKDGHKALEFYEKGLGAKKLGAMPDASGKLMHAALRIGDSIVFLHEECVEKGARSPQTLRGTPVSLNLYLEDCDAAFHRAVSAGATPTMKPENMFWGDRYAVVTDPFGHQWAFLTHVEDVAPADMERRAREFTSAQART